MAGNDEFDNIPRGNTAPGVNRLMIEYLTPLFEKRPDIRILDIPCGKGEFLDALKRMLPDATTTGADINTPGDSYSHKFQQIDAHRPLAIDRNVKYDAISCISGVMEFDNTLLFFEQIRELISPKGEFLVTNDNLLTVRDRALYFLFGRFRQYRHATRSDTPTWKIIPLQNMIRILSDARFSVVRIIYVSPRFTEWLWLPLAIPIYLAQYAYIKFANVDVEEQTIREMFPFVSLLSRHYILVCRPKS